jgi:hypothetical protein
MYEVRMSGFLPASPAARRREEAVRAEFRREAMDRLEAKVDQLVEMTKGAAQAAPTPPTVTEEDVEWAAEALAKPGALGLYPRGSIASVVTKLFDGETRTLATSITIWPLQPLSIREALECGLIKGASLQHHVYERMVRELPERAERVIRPHEQAAQPAARARW